MAKQLFANNAKTSMSGSLAVGGTTFVCASGEGAKFPTPTGGDYFLMTLFELDVGGNEIKLEVVKVTARTGDSFTIVRDIESMTGNAGGYAYAGGASVCYAQMRVTAKTMTDMAQNADADFTGAVTMASDLTVSGNIYGGNFYARDASTPISIRPITADGSDNQYAALSGGGSTATAARGAYVAAYGNEHANAGALHLSSGTGGDILIRNGGTTVMTVSGATGYVKHAYPGAAATPVYCLANTTDTGLYGSANSVGLAASGVQVARFYDGFSGIGSGATSSNVFHYQYGSLSQATGPSLQGFYQRVTFPVATGVGTNLVSQFYMANTLDINDAGGALTIANVYGVNVNTPTINSSNAGTVISAFTQHRAADLPDTKIAIGRGYRSEVNEVSGKTRWQFEGAGTAASYDGGDRHIAGNRYDKQAAPVAANTTSTLGTAAVLGRLITTAPAAAINLTLPDGTTMDAATPQLGANFSFDWTVVNTSASFTATVLQGSSGHTVVGNMVVAVSSSATFRTRRTGTNTFITYRIS